MAGIMLVAFASRALIPAGFMPASGAPFSLEICREGLPAGWLAQVDSSHAESMDMGDMPMGDSASHHSGTPSDGEHCVFGTACSAGPAPHLPLASLYSSAGQLRAVAFASLAASVRVVHLPQPRAPPALLS
jgi:hypothetical protein